MGLLAQSALIPGFSSLLLLLTTSLTEKSCIEMLSEVKGRPGKRERKQYCKQGLITQVYLINFSVGRNGTKRYELDAGLLVSYGPLHQTLLMGPY